MSRYLGLDLGSTSITAVVIDTAARAVTAVTTRSNDAERTTAADRTRGRSEWEFERMLSLTVRCAGEACDGAPVEAIGVTGQQKGCQLLAGDGSLIGPYIGWQDRRTAEPAAGESGGRTWLDLVAERGGAITPRGERPRFADSGCPVAHGFTVPLLFWLQQAGELPAAAHAGTAPELLVARLTGTRAVTDPTNAAGWGSVRRDRRSLERGSGSAARSGSIAVAGGGAILPGGRAAPAGDGTRHGSAVSRAGLGRLR